MHRFVVLAALLCGCVTPATYERALTERDAAREEVADLEQRNAALQTRIGRVNDDVLVLGATIQAQQAELERLTATREELEEALVLEREAGLIAIEAMKDGFRVELSEEVLFPPGSADLSERGHRVLGRVAETLADVPYQVLAAGYTDDVPIGGQLAARFPSNWELAGARAAGVVRLLESQGIAATRLAAVSFGSTRPVAPNDSAANRALNRRIELRVRPVVAE